MKYLLKKTINAQAIMVLTRWKDDDFWSSNALNSCYCMIKPLIGCSCMHLPVWRQKGLTIFFILLWCARNEKCGQGSLCISLYISFKIMSIVLCNLNTTLQTVGERVTVLFNPGTLTFFFWQTFRTTSRKKVLESQHRPTIPTQRPKAVSSSVTDSSLEFWLPL